MQLAIAGILLAWNGGTLVSTGSAQQPPAHASTHAQSGSDPINPLSIGALNRSNDFMVGVSPSKPVLKLQGVLAQSAPLQEWRDGLGNLAALVTPSGTGFFREIGVASQVGGTTASVFFETGGIRRFALSSTDNALDIVRYGIGGGFADRPLRIFRSGDTILQVGTTGAPVLEVGSAHVKVWGSISTMVKGPGFLSGLTSDIGIPDPSTSNYFRLGVDRASGLMLSRIAGGPTQTYVTTTAPQFLTGKILDGSLNQFSNIPDSALGVVKINKGGTGQSTKVAAMDALSPANAKGDLLTHNGVNVIRLPVGSDGERLTADTSSPAGMKWVKPGAELAPSSHFRDWTPYLYADHPPAAVDDGFGTGPTAAETEVFMQTGIQMAYWGFDDHVDEQISGVLHLPLNWLGTVDVTLTCYVPHVDGSVVWVLYAGCPRRVDWTSDGDTMGVSNIWAPITSAEEDVVWRKQVPLACKHGDLMRWQIVRDADDDAAEDTQSGDARCLSLQLLYQTE